MPKASKTKALKHLHFFHITSANQTICKSLIISAESEKGSIHNQSVMEGGLVSINTCSIRKVMFFLFTSVSTIRSCAVAHLHIPFNVICARWEKPSKAVTRTQNTKWGLNPRKTPVQLCKCRNAAEKQRCILPWLPRFQWEQQTPNRVVGGAEEVKDLLQ